MVTGTQVCGPSSAFLGALAGSWIESGGAGILTSALIWAAGIAVGTIVLAPRVRHLEDF